MSRRAAQVRPTLTRASIYDEPKIDCHSHLLNPTDFPYHPEAWYHPVAGPMQTRLFGFE